MVVDREIEGSVDGMLARCRADVVVGAGEELLLEPVSFAAVHCRLAACRDAGHPLASIRAVGQ